jgi:peptidyl-prolyl cis-trans isomerase SurA
MLLGVRSKEDWANGGFDQNTQDTRFELTKMDPSLYSIEFKDDSISQPMWDTDENGKKKL